MISKKLGSGTFNIVKELMPKTLIDKFTKFAPKNLTKKFGMIGKFISFASTMGRIINDKESSSPKKIGDIVSELGGIAIGMGAGKIAGFLAGAIVSGTGLGVVAAPFIGAVTDIIVSTGAIKLYDGFARKPIQTYVTNIADDIINKNTESKNPIVNKLLNRDYGGLLWYFMKKTTPLGILTNVLNFDISKKIKDKALNSISNVGKGALNIASNTIGKVSGFMGSLFGSSPDEPISQPTALKSNVVEKQEPKQDNSWWKFAKTSRQQKQPTSKQVNSEMPNNQTNLFETVDINEISQKIFRQMKNEISLEYARIGR